MHDEILAPLTPAQREAVCHRDGPLLVLAGPGSGKTRVVTHRIAWLLREGIPPERMLALTFTNKAADEVRGRVAEMVDEAPVWMGTFHRFCSRLLRKYAHAVGLEPNFAIYDTSDSRRVLRAAIEGLDRGAAGFKPERIATAISHAKNALMTADDYAPRPGFPLGAIVAEAYPLYQARLAAANAVDFDDLLLHVATLLRGSDEIRAALDDRYRYIMVDEYQDTNLAQYTIVRALSIDHPNLAVTGDPDQSIYGWRGANVQNILDFEHDYPRVRIVRLEQNYRSTQRILSVADSLIGYNRRRKAKRLFTDNPLGEPVRYAEYYEEKDESGAIAEEIAAAVRSGERRPRDFAVFYRVNALSRTLEEALRRRGIPFQVVRGVEFYQRKEIKDLVSYLCLLNNPRDWVAFERVVNTPARGLGKKTVARVQEWSSQRGVSPLEAARDCESIEGLSTAARKRLRAFAALIDRLSERTVEPVEAIVGHVLSETDFESQFDDPHSEDDQQRLANIRELLTAARQFDQDDSHEGGLEAFLEQASLVNDVDDWETASDSVTLMTLHAAKGLEFDVVYLVALEEGLLPHERSKERPEELEEERRLLFVGMTRARERLCLSRARKRAFRGQVRTTVPSSFLLELPQDEILWQRDPTRTTTTKAAPKRRAASRNPADYRGGLVTASELSGVATAAQPAEPALSPEQFTQGMVVHHPEYGLGKIVALSGSASRRMATVNFVQNARQGTFDLAYAPLRPAGE